MIYLFLACSGGDSSDVDPKSGGDSIDVEPKETPTDEVIIGKTYYQDVAPILSDNCLSCHTDEGSGPFSFDTYENVKALGSMIEYSVTQRRMPPFHANNSGECQEFEHSIWLSDDEISTISEWVEGGMQEGEFVDIERNTIEEAPFQSTHTVTFEPYEANFATSSDDYRCFIVEPNVEEEGYLTGFEVLPSNREIAHHMILYAPRDSNALNQAYAKDEADPGPGYSCYGDPGVDNRMIAPWAPGSDQWFYPEGTGVRMEEGQILILQMHYSNASEDPLDSTTVNLHIQETIDKELYTEFFVHSDIEIPANTTDHIEKSKKKVSTYSGYDGPILLQSIGPHLHKLGVSSSAKVIREDGTEECLIDVPNYDFNWQRVYTYSNPILLNPNDKLEIECVFDSTGVDQTTYWGDGTSDEMCLMTVFATLP